MDTLSAFKNPESEARYLAAYDAVLARWPVPYETMMLSTRLGETHAIASGPRDAFPLLLLPAISIVRYHGFTVSRPSAGRIEFMRWIPSVMLGGAKPVNSRRIEMILPIG